MRPKKTKVPNYVADISAQAKSGSQTATPNAADSTSPAANKTGPINFGRHSANCRICSHPERVEIENDFIDWKSPTQIALEYQLANRSSVYRHARAFNLFRRRGHNLKAALDRLIEKVDDVEISGGAIVSAVQRYAKINARGEWVERDERLYLDDLFDRMTPDECAAYAQNGTLPRWFQEAIAAAGARVANGQGSDDE